MSVTSWGFNNGAFGLVRAGLRAATAWAHARPELKSWRVTTAKAHGVSKRAAVLAQQGWEKQNPRERDTWSEAKGRPDAKHLGLALSI